MEIEKCFEILEVDKDSSSEKIKEAYRDIINVWHPDRFSGNPRLKEKAEGKVKEINEAYEILQSYTPAKQQHEPWDKEGKGQASDVSESSEESGKPYKSHRHREGKDIHRTSGKNHKYKGKHKKRHKDKSRSGRHGHHR